MGAEVQHGVGVEILAQPAVIGAEGVGRRKTPLEQQTHRVAFIAEARLDADKHVAELLAQHEDVAPVGQLPPRRRAPLPLDLVQMRLAAHMVVGADAGVHVGVLTEAVGVALQHPVAQRIDAFGNLDRIARVAQRAQRVEQRLEHRQERRRAGGARVGRKVEDGQRDAPLGPPGAAQADHLFHAARQHLGALGAHVHVAGRGAVGEVAGAVAALAMAADRAGAPAEHRGAGGAVDLGDRDHDRRLDRRQPARAAAPFLKRLELQRMGGDIGHVQPRQDVGGGAAVIIGRPADQAEPGQRHHRVHHRRAILHEEPLDRRARVQPAGEGRDHPQAARLQRRDGAVIVARVARQDVGAHHQQADRAVVARLRQRLGAFGHAARQFGVIDAGLGILQRRLRLDGAPAAIAADQIAQHVGDVVVGTGQKILHRQEIGAQVLGLAGDVFQDLGQAAQHLHLARAGRSARLGLAAQPLQERQRPGLLHAHVELADPGQLDHLGRRHHGDQPLAVVASRFQRRQDRLDVLVEKHHRDHDQIGLRHRRAAAVERAGQPRPFRRGVQAHLDPGALGVERRLRARHRRAQMAVERDDGDAHRAGLGQVLSAHNGPWHRKASPP